VNVNSTLEENANISFEIIQCDSTSTNIILTKNNIDYDPILKCFKYYINWSIEGQNIAIGSYLIKWNTNDSVNDYPSIIIEELTVHPNNDLTEINLNSIEDKIDICQIDQTSMNDKIDIINNDLNSIEDKIDICQIDQTSMNDKIDIINNDLNSIENDVKRILGLVHENLYIDNTQYDDFNNLISGRLRIYSDSNSVGSNKNIIATYEIECESDKPGTFINWKQIKI
jgi:hypothetical protein